MSESFLSAGWKSVLVILALLPLCCGHESPKASSDRMTEPRLTGFDTWQPCTMSLPAGHIVASADCRLPNLPRKPVSIAVSECDDTMRTDTETLTLLASAEQCTDAVVEKLETLAHSRSKDAALLSDLAGAYYIRAQRDDRPADFVRALDAADRSVDLAPVMPAARFNRALAQEALGFSDDAIASWDGLRREPDPSWAAEAKAHYDRLQSERSHAAGAQWSLNRLRLPEAAASGDRVAVRQLVAPFPSSAQRYVDEVVLPAWAKASQEKRLGDAAMQLQLAELVAAAVGAITNDRYLPDMVERIRSSRNLEEIAKLAAGHLAFANARALQRQVLFEKAAPIYTQATAALSDSPLRLESILGTASAQTQTRDFAGARNSLRLVEREASARHYPSILARVRAGMGFLFAAEQREIDSLTEYSAAKAAYEGIHDMEGAGAVRSVIIGLYRRIGHLNLTWRAAYEAEQHAKDLVEAQSRHVHWGEHAVSALELGYPRVALHYQDIAVQMLERELSDPANTGNPDQLRANLGIAHRVRAGIHLYLDDRASAERDIAASVRLLGDPVDGGKETNIPLAFQARLAELDAQRLAEDNKLPQAIGKLSEAIALSSKTYYQTLIASLRLQRAELHRRNGDRAAAAEDLKNAITILRTDEKAALKNSGNTLKTPVEELWSAYFARSQDAYRRLVRLYVEDGDDVQAFEYAERARAYEPLHLVLQRKDLPPSFRSHIHGEEPFRLADVEQSIPAGTFLLHYTVFDEQSYVWMIGKGFSDRRTLPVGENAIRDWTRKLQKLAERKDGGRFNNVLEAASKALLDEPLAVIAKLQGGARAKIVIVPDRPMHGLPFSAFRNGDRLVIEDHAVAVAASATLYAYSLAQDEQQSPGIEQSVLLVADPAFDARLGATYDLPDLPGARSEAEQIRGVYAGAARVGAPLMDANATVAAFLRLAPDSTIIHLAVHGVANPEVPSRSFLLLAPAGDDDKGVLDAERLLKQFQSNKTRLAVLSACRSAGGTSVGPEGLSPLVRPFVAAGVPGVVGTLWDVSDRFVTEKLLVQFHQHYRDGHDAAEALRLAQLDVHKEKGPGVTWAWSAFQLYGNASSPFAAPAAPSGSSQ